MKTRTFLVLGFLLLVSVLNAQSNSVTLYGFKQKATGGMQKRGEIDESGKLIKTPSDEAFQYTIYLASTSKAKVYPVQMWINGEAHAIKSRRVTKFPVQVSNTVTSDSTQQSRIPATAGAVWQLFKQPLTTDKSGGRAKALAITNDVVVLYKNGGKLQYATLKKFTELDPAILQ